MTITTKFSAGRRVWLVNNVADNSRACPACHQIVYVRHNEIIEGRITCIRVAVCRGKVLEPEYEIKTSTRMHTRFQSAVYASRAEAKRNA